MSSGKKKIKIEIEDDDGGKYNLSLEGNISKTKLMKAIDFMGLINGNTDKDNNDDHGDSKSEIYSNYKNTITRENEFEEPDISIPLSPTAEDSSSLTSKIWSLIETRLSKTSFTSSDVVLLYKREYNEFIGLDKVATYLARYHQKGKLARSKRTKEWVYKLTAASKPQLIQNENNIGNYKKDTLPKYYPSSNQIHATDFN